MPSTPFARRSEKPAGRVGSEGTLRSLREEMAAASLIALSALFAFSILGSISASAASFRNASSFMPVGTCCSSTFFSAVRSEEHTSELQSLMRISYAVFCLKKKKYTKYNKECISHIYKYNNNHTTSN